MGASRSAGGPPPLTELTSTLHVHVFLSALLNLALQKLLHEVHSFGVHTMLVRATRSARCQAAVGAFAAGR